jgi:hypothetical protein
MSYRLRSKGVTRDRTRWTQGLRGDSGVTPAYAQADYIEDNSGQNGHLPHREDYSVKMVWEDSPSDPALTGASSLERWPVTKSVGGTAKGAGFVHRRRLSHSSSLTAARISTPVENFWSSYVPTGSGWLDLSKAQLDSYDGDPAVSSNGWLDLSLATLDSYDGNPAVSSNGWVNLSTATLG